MTDGDTTASNISSSETYIQPEWDDNGKVHWPGIHNQEKSRNARAVLLMPPIKTIPIIFIPGVMGTNLMSNKTAQTEAIWRGDSIRDVYLKWAALDGEPRRKLLNPDTSRVDNRGDINQKIYSPYSDDGKLFPSRRDRGWGEVLSFSYGKFLSVFQGALLDDWQLAAESC